MKFIILKGGLGNQLFQLNAFYYFKEKYKIHDLQIDYITGFLWDYKYKRNLEIDKVKDKKIKLRFIFINSLLLIIKKTLPLIINLLPVLLIDDESVKKLGDRKSSLNKKYILIDGYFQNSKYVNIGFESLYNSVKYNLKRDLSLKFRKLIEDILGKKNSVAICIRFYEESKNPLDHTCHKNGLKTVDDFNKIIGEIELKVSNPSFFIFVQNQNKFTDKLRFKSSFRFITHEKGFIGSWQRMLAQSSCNHHVINNSTFYYWGLVFSKNNNFPKSKSLIYVSDNFVNKNIYNIEWNKF